MCGRFGQIDKDALAEAFQVDASELYGFEPNYNTDIGSYAALICNDVPEKLQWSMFGLTPFWLDKLKYVFNARSEGDNNKENDPNYFGEKGIFKKPFFRHLKRKRCILPVQYFIEGPKKERMKKPYIVERTDKRPFALGGLWDEWTDKETGEIIPTFTIITTPNNELLGKVGHHRSPLLIPGDMTSEWLDPEVGKEEIERVMEPFDPSGFHAYRVSPEIRRKNDKGQNNAPDLLKQVGTELRV